MTTYTSYKNNFLSLYLEIKKIAENPLVKYRIHITSQEFSRLSNIKDELENNVIAAEKDDYNYIDAKALIIVASTYMGDFETAVSLLSFNELERSSIDVYGVIINVHLDRGNWTALTSLKNSLPEEVLKRYKDAFDIVELNVSGKTSSSNDDSGFLDSFISDEFTFDNKYDFFHNIQIATNRWRDNKSRKEIREFLVSVEFHSLGILEQFMYLEALIICELQDEFQRHAESFLTEVEPGVGNVYFGYLIYLLKQDKRKRIDEIFTKMVTDLIFSDNRFAIFYLYFLKNYKNIGSEDEDLLRQLESTNDLGIKIHLLDFYRNVLGDISRVKKLITFWGIPQAEVSNPIAKATYLQFAVDYFPLKRICDELYPIYLYHSHLFDLQRIAVYILWNPLVQRVKEEEIRNSRPSEYQFAIQIADQRIPVLIDKTADRLRQSAACFDEDIIEIDFNSIHAGSELDIQGEQVVISEVLNKYIWMVRHSIENLSQKPEKSHIWMIQAGDDVSFIEQITEITDRDKEARRKKLAKAESCNAPIASIMQGDKGNHFEGWLEFYKAEKQMKYRHHLEEFFESFENDGLKFVLDSSALLPILSFGADMDFLAEVPAFITNSLAVEVRNCLGSLFEEFNNLSRNGELISNRNLIGVVDSIPGSEPPVELLNLLDVIGGSTKDILLSSYGHKDHVLISDDPFIQRVCKFFSIRCINSFTFLRVINLYRGVKGYHEEAAQIFTEIGTDFFVVDGVPPFAISYLFSSSCPEDKFVQFITANLGGVQLSIGNVYLLIVSLLMSERSDDFAERLKLLLKDICASEVTLKIFQFYMRQTFTEIFGAFSTANLLNLLVDMSRDILLLKLDLPIAPYSTEEVYRRAVRSL